MARNESPDKIFDPKPPTLSGIPSAENVVAPVQNVFQFNVRVNNNTQQVPAGIIVQP